MALAAFMPAVAYAHERWVRHEALPFDKDYFRSMTGEVLQFSLMAALAVAGVVAIWYLVAVDLVERLTPATPDARAREARRPLLVRKLRWGLRFLLDGDVGGAWMDKGERIAALIFARLPAGVLILGCFEQWLVMPSFPLPLHGSLGPVLTVVQGALAAWILVGRWLRPLGAVMFAVFVYLCVAYGSAGIDAIPVLASAFFYYFAGPKAGEVNARQIGGIRLSLGVGFFLLGLINKIYFAELFIGVGDSYPQLIEGPQKLFPWLTREAWSYTTALGEMTFGLLLLLGLFDKITTLALSAIFTNFIFTFGFAEIVHLYPIAGFAVLFFHAPPGTVLDGAIFRTHVGLWRATGHQTSLGIYGLAVLLVAFVAAALLMFGPLFLFVHVIPLLGG